MIRLHSVLALVLLPVALAQECPGCSVTCNTRTTVDGTYNRDKIIDVGCTVFGLVRCASIATTRESLPSLSQRKNAVSRLEEEVLLRSVLVTTPGTRYGCEGETTIGCRLEIRAQRICVEVLGQ